MRKLTILFGFIMLSLLIVSCAKQEAVPTEKLPVVSDNASAQEKSVPADSSAKPIIPENITVTDISVKQNATKEELVRIIDVTESGDSCILSIKGTTVVIDKGKEETVNGVTVHVFDIKPVHSQLADKDLCNILISVENSTG